MEGKVGKVGKGDARGEQRGAYGLILFSRWLGKVCERVGGWKYWKYKMIRRIYAGLVKITLLI